MLRLLLIPLFCLSMPLAAEAHVGLKDSSPAQNAALTAPPEAITLTFSGAVEQKYGRFTLVKSPTGGPVSEDVQLSAAKNGEPYIIRLPLPALAPGAYLLRYRVVAGDGHPVKGELVFTYNPR